jgi:hypothetical protein
LLATPLADRPKGCSTTHQRQTREGAASSSPPGPIVLADFLSR